MSREICHLDNRHELQVPRLLLFRINISRNLQPCFSATAHSQTLSYISTTNTETAFRTRWGPLAQIRCIRERVNRGFCHRSFHLGTSKASRDLHTRGSCIPVRRLRGINLIIFAVLHSSERIGQARSSDCQSTHRGRNSDCDRLSLRCQANGVHRSGRRRIIKDAGIW